MRNASLTDLESRMGAEAFAAWLKDTPNPQSELTGCGERLLAYILPARPRSQAQEDALARAVCAQLHWEITSEAGAVPEGVKSFTLGSFSAQMEAARPAVCREARSILLNAGLLCREVNRC